MSKKSNTVVFASESPTEMYVEALHSLLSEGKDVAPRGKSIKELRPVIFENHNPLRRVTFAKGRVINPFFQLAESLWILAGRADVAWLTQYNASMANFSDDGVHFNAPYGERLRYWDKSSLHGQVDGEYLDQIEDIITKIQLDPDTRQAIGVIYNPNFDHANYRTLDRPCNMLLNFKLRDGKLDLNVYNRSNDLHWGVFGANLAQFATIQEYVATRLGVEVGVYYQTTDSLHIYTDSYGHGESAKMLEYYPEYKEDTISDDIFYTTIEPRMGQCHATARHLVSGGRSDIRKTLDMFFDYLDPQIFDNATYASELSIGDFIRSMNHIDSYIRMSALAMAAYRCHKAKDSKNMLLLLKAMPNCSWKFSCLRFLYKSHGESVLSTLDGSSSVYADPEVIQYIRREETK